MKSTIITNVLFTVLYCTFNINAVSTQGVHSVQTKVSTTEVESIRSEYINLEKTLWNYLEWSGASVAARIRKIFDSHSKFFQDHLQKNFDKTKYEILKFYEWSILERDLLQISAIFRVFMEFMGLHNNSTQLEERAVLDIIETVLRNDTHFSMSRIFQEIEENIVNQRLYSRIMSESSNQICHTQQSAQQFIYSLYADIALTELKGYTMMEFSWMMLRIYGKGDFAQEAELMRAEYGTRTERTLKLLREVMRHSDRIVWRCDPEKYVKGETYDEVTRLLQGYIENEVDMNDWETCRNDCAYYQNTKDQGCFQSSYCSKQPKCGGRLHNCKFLDSDMWICPSYNSTRRYEFIEYENGRLLGKKKYCEGGLSKADSWWRFVVHCSYCFCLCDEQSEKSDRYFNLRETLADVKNNKVVTGLRFVKKKRVFHLQIQEGELMSRGTINTTNLSWKPVDEYSIFGRETRNKKDYYVLTYEERSIDLDDIHTDDNAFVVTGVRFRHVGAHLNLEARLTQFDFEKGILANPEETSYWRSNDNTDVSGIKREKIELQNPDVSTNTLLKSIPDLRHNQYIDFVNTDMDKDAAQSTVPFIDIQDVVSNPPVPLAGIGMYHKGFRGYGGFIAPKIVTYDYTPHVQLSQDPKTDNNIQRPPIF